MIAEGLKLAVLGMGVVFSFLILLQLVIGLSARVLNYRTLKEKELLTIKK